MIGKQISGKVTGVTTSRVNWRGYEEIDLITLIIEDKGNILHRTVLPLNSKDTKSVSELLGVDFKVKDRTIVDYLEQILTRREVYYHSNSDINDEEIYGNRSRTFWRLEIFTEPGKNRRVYVKYINNPTLESIL